MNEAIDDCSDPIAAIQVYLASLAWLEPCEGWTLAHSDLRAFCPEFERYGWYAMDFEELTALAEALSGIHAQVLKDRLNGQILGNVGD
jgi:hypothetical protein